MKLKGDCIQNFIILMNILADSITCDFTNAFCKIIHPCFRYRKEPLSPKQSISNTRLNQRVPKETLELKFAFG